MSEAEFGFHAFLPSVRLMVFTVAHTNNATAGAVMSLISRLLRSAAGASLILAGASAAGHGMASTARPPVGTVCADFEGSNHLQDWTGVVFVGEHRGTRETPRMFGSLVCNAGKQRRVHVALELPEDWTGPLNDYVLSDDDATALATFLVATEWKKSVDAYPDGRTSEGVIELLRYLKRLRRDGYDLTLSAFDTRPWESPKARTDVGMAAALTRQIEKSHADLTLVLSGEYHARLRENTTPAVPQPMAFLVAGARPTWMVRSLLVTYSAGALWGCSMTKCGELYQPVPLALGAPKLALLPALDSFGYVGELYVGAISASLPYVEQVKK